MKTTFAAILALTVIALTGCSSSTEPEGISESEQHQAYCSGFARLTPGTLEMGEASDILRDPASTSAEKSQASKDYLDATVRKAPYDCESTDDSELFEQFVADQKTNSGVLDK